MYILVFFLLFVGCILLFLRARWLELAAGLMRKSKRELDDAAKRRMLENRKELFELQKKRIFWRRLEQELHYSGLKRRMPFLTAELGLACNLFVMSCVGVVLLWRRGIQSMLLGVFGLAVGEYLILYILKVRAFRSVNDNLMKFLDFLGNYSITAGELTGIFAQISKYMEEPLKTALEECSYEAQTTGDAGLALLSMSEKIEHPKFKELVRNMEISVRYCADFSLLVRNSRRMLQEYLRMRQERSGMLREAFINMMLLLGMSLMALFVVNRLLDVSVWFILVQTVPGKIALGVVGFILFLFVCRLMERR